RGQPTHSSLKNERMLKRVPCADHFRGGCWLVLMHFIVRQERTGNAELGVGIEMGIVRRIDLRGDGLKASLVNQKMQVRWAKVVPFLGIEQSAHRTIYGDRVPRRLNTSEAEFSIGISRKLAAQVHLCLLRVLAFLETDRGRVPDIDLGSGNRPAFLVEHPTFKE